MLIEWEDDQVALVDLQGARKADSWPYNHKRSDRFTQVPNRQVSEMVVHHSAGGFYEGMEAIRRLENYFLKLPEYKKDEGGSLVLKNGSPVVIGGGRGWPGIPYTFVIPAIPEVRNGKLVAYRIWPDNMRTWHTGGIHNSYGVGICVGGWYQSGPDPLSKSARPRPDQAAMVVLDRLVGYLAQRYGLQLGAETLIAHREAGSTACPGDYLAEWVRQRRGEPSPEPLVGPEDWRPLETVRQVQEALVELGYNPGPVDGLYGPLTSSGLRSFQAQNALKRDGIFGPKTERAIRVALGALPK